MSPESDGGLDKLKVLSAITGPAPAPTAPTAPRAPDRPPSALQRIVENPVAAGPAWFRHRSELAALTSAFVGMIWLAVGLAQGAWGPSLAGIAFGIASLAIWTEEVWNNG